MKRSPINRRFAKSGQYGLSKRSDGKNDGVGPSDAALGNLNRETRHIAGAQKKRRTLDDLKHGELEALLDAEVSFFVRAMPASYSEAHGYVQCVTCGTWHHWKTLDCGHYIPRHHQGTRYDLRNVRPQCTKCNCYHEGEHWRFRQVLIEELGDDEVKALELTASIWGATRHPKEWLIAEIKAWRVRNKPLRAWAKEEGA